MQIAAAVCLAPASAKQHRLVGCAEDRGHKLRSVTVTVTDNVRLRLLLMTDDYYVAIWTDD